MSEFPLSPKTEKLLPLTRRNFLALGLLMFLSGDTARKTETEGGRIFQTGIKEMELNGEKYEIKIIPEKFIEAVLYEAPYFDSLQEGLSGKAESWFRHNQLELEIYDFSNNPAMFLHEGYYIPRELNLLSGRAVLGIRIDQIKQLAMLKTGIVDSSSFLYNDSKKPYAVIGHEMAHLLENIGSPDKALEVAEGLKSVIKDKTLAISGSLAGIWITTKLLRADDRKLLARLGGANLGVGSIRMLVENINEIIQLTTKGIVEGIESDDLHSNYFKRASAENFGRIDFGYQSLVKEAIEFNRIK